MPDMDFGRLDATARALVEAHLPLAKSLARRYRYSGLPLEDLESEALIGLLRAAERYEDRGRPFGVYATLWMKSYIRAYLARYRISAASESDEVLAGVPSDRPSPEAVFIEGERTEELRAVLQTTWGTLDRRERAILTDRLMTDGEGASLQVLANRFGVTGERVRQVEKKLLTKLRGLLDAREPALSAA